MVIQRWQSVCLLIAAVMMAIFSFVPMASVTTDVAVAQLQPQHFPVWMIVNLLIALLLFLAIFMFNNLKRQKSIILVSLVLIGASVVTGGLTLYGPNAPEGAVEIVWLGGILLLVAAVVFALMARRLISRDQRKLSESDRIR